MNKKIIALFLSVSFISGCATKQPTINLNQAAVELAQAVDAFDKERERLGADKDLIIEELSATLNLTVVDKKGVAGGGSNGTFKVGDRLYGFNFSRDTTSGNTLVIKFKSAPGTGTHHLKEALQNEE